MAADTEKALPFKKKPSLMVEMDEPSPSSDDMTTDKDESEGDYSAAAGEVFDALKTEDREGFITALKAALMSCK